MASKQAHLSTALVLWFGLLAPATVLGGPYLGEWSWCWHPARDCPRGEYSAFHYWVPGFYKVRANVHPSSLDQYPPGPNPPVSAVFETTRYPCRSTPATVGKPYADPVGYYGRQVLPD